MIILPIHGPLKTLVWPGAFTAALLLAPTSIAMLGASLFFLSPIFPLVALFSVFMGGPIYLILGGPTLFYWLRSGQNSPISAAALGFCVNIAFCLIAVLIARVVGKPMEDDFVMMFMFCGSIFAPVWSAVFALTYNYLTRNDR